MNHPNRKRRPPHDLIACGRVPDSQVRYTPFMNQTGGNAVSDLYECPTCKRRGRFLQARLKGIACDGRRFVRSASPLQMEVAKLRAAGEWPQRRLVASHDGIEIDHGDRDISAAVREGGIEIGIGEDFSGRSRSDKPQGYARWAAINLTMDEVITLRDWLTSKIVTR